MPSRFAAVLTGIVMLVAGCAGQNAPPASTASNLNGSITVFAASSLTDAVSRIGADFEKAHPGVMLHFTFAGSSTLAAQIEQGAIGDVFASAHQTTMQKLVQAGLVSGTPPVFPRNHLQIVVARGNPEHISGLADLSRAGLVVVLCAPAVPCGPYAGQALERAAVTVRPASQEATSRRSSARSQIGRASCR